MAVAVVFAALTLAVLMRINMISVLIWCWALVWCGIYYLSGG